MEVGYMLMYGKNFGLDLVDESKELSKENPAVGYHMFGVCKKCGKSTEIKSYMLTDNHTDRDGYGCTGWEYRCTCGTKIFCWEGAFDSYFDYLYENDLLIEEEDEDDFDMW